MLNIHHFAKQQASTLTATTCSQPFMPDCDVYKVFNKIYLMTFTYHNSRVINIKVQPEQGDMLRDIYPFIHTGYYMNKQHWISVYEHEDLNKELLQDLICTSYQLVISKLTRAQKKQLEILQATKNTSK